MEKRLGRMQEIAVGLLSSIYSVLGLRVSLRDSKSVASGMTSQ